MGNKRGHKGGHRRFTNPQEIALRKEKEEREKEWRRKRGEIVDSDEEDEDNSQEDEESSEEEQLPVRKDQQRKDVRSARPAAARADDDDEEEEDESDGEPLIEICNPNRMPEKAKKDVNALVDEQVILSRKDREQIEKQRAKEQHAKLTAEGKTRQAREDLARLAIIKQKREEAARKKNESAKRDAQASTSKSVKK